MGFCSQEEIAREVKTYFCMLKKRSKTKIQSKHFSVHVTDVGLSLT